MVVEGTGVAGDLILKRSTDYPTPSVSNLNAGVETLVEEKEMLGVDI